MLLPRRQLVIETGAPPAAVRAHLATFIGDGRPFSGTVGPDAFVAHRRGSLLRFGLPRVEGRLEDHGGGTLVRVSLRLEPLFVALYLPWLTLMLAASAAFVSQTLRAGGLAPGAFGPALLAVLVHVMVRGTFAGETAIVRRYLSSLGQRPSPEPG